MESYETMYNNICRVCLRYSKHKMVPLLDKSTDDGISCFGKSIMIFANITIKCNTELPTYMCQHCLYLLKNAIKFKLKCEQSNRKILKLLSSHDETKQTLKEAFVEYSLYVHHFSNNNIINITKDSKNNFKETNDSRNSNEDVNKLTVNQFENDDEGNYDEVDVNDDLCDDADSILNVMAKMTGVDCDVDHKLLETTVVTLQENHSNEDLTKDLNMISVKKRRSKGVKVKKGLRRYVRQRQQALKSATDKQSYSCNICGKELATRQSFGNHMQKHYGYKFICELCGKGYALKCQLDYHQAHIHGVGDLLECQHCNFKTSRRFDLVEHLRLHTGERPFTCDKCGRSFRRKYIYTRHLVHHSEKTVQCPHCPRRFYHRGYMLEHCNNVHERRFIYSCVRCGCLYAKSATLRRHLLLKHDVPREQQVLHKLYSNSRQPLGVGNGT